MTYKIMINKLPHNEQKIHQVKRMHTTGDDEEAEEKPHVTLTFNSKHDKRKRDHSKETL